MRTFLSTMVALSLMLVVAAEARQAGATDPRETAEKTIIANERALYEAVARADKPAFQALVAPEGVWTTSTGFVPTRLLGDALGTFHLKTWKLENLRVTWLDENSALVLYVRTVDGRFGEGALPATALASTIWIR